MMLGMPLTRIGSRHCNLTATGNIDVLLNICLSLTQVSFSYQLGASLPKKIRKYYAMPCNWIFLVISPVLVYIIEIVTTLY